MEQKNTFTLRNAQVLAVTSSHIRGSNCTAGINISATGFRNQMSPCFNIRESNHCLGRESFGTKANTPLHVVFDPISSFQQNAKDKNVTNPIFTTCGN